MNRAGPAQSATALSQKLRNMLAQPLKTSEIDLYAELNGLLS